MPGVFCSFTYADLPFAHELALELAQHSYPVWLDRFKVDLVGTPLTAEITAGLRACDCVVAVVSAETPDSAWVHRELGIAQDLGLPVLQIVLDGAQAFPGYSDEHYADVMREGREGAIAKIVTAAGRYCRHDFEVGSEPIIPLFLDFTTRLNLVRLQQRLEYLADIRDRLDLTGGSVAVAMNGDGSLLLTRALDELQDPLLGQVRALVRRFDTTMREGIARTISNTNQWRMFQGAGGAAWWPVHTGYCVAAFFEIVRSIIMARLLLVTDNATRDLLVPADRNLPADPVDIQQDPVATLRGVPTTRLDVFHKGEPRLDAMHEAGRVPGLLPPRWWGASPPSASFTVPAGNSLATEVEKSFHTEATDFPHELCTYIVPQMLLRWLFDPVDRKIWWDFDACAVGPH